MSKNFDTAIKSQLELRRGEWLDVAKQAGVSHSWISKFVNGHIPNPGYGTLVKLSDVLNQPSATATQQEAAHG